MNIKIRLYLVVLISLAIQGLCAQTIRTIDGSNNNFENTEWGSLGDVLYELTNSAFSDNISEINGLLRPNPRHISNILFDQSDAILDEQNLSDYVWVFGQFIDHDIVLVDNDLSEPLAIRIPEDDQTFTADGAPIGMFRSRGMLGTGNSEDNVRKYANEVTAYIDGSGIYGSTEARAKWLRTFEDGKLKTSIGDLLPWNTKTGEFNDPKENAVPFMDDPVRISSKHFVAGDIRANENPLLIGFHTLFLREHNRLCDEIKINYPDFNDEEIYQKARKMVGGFLQSITYQEWLPAMGISLPQYNGYRGEENAQISNVFSAAAFRMGHTLINGNILRIEGNGEEIPSGSISLRDAFFNPTAINLAGGIDPYLRGMAAQIQQKLDCKVIDDVRNFLFGSPNQGGLDLAAININRGRERGLGDFNSIRRDLGLPALKSMYELTSDVESVDLLLQLYESVDEIDPWVGMLAEDYMPGAMFGSTIKAILEEQFQRLRDGDKFYYEVDPGLTPDEKGIIRQTTMRDIIMRNTDIKVMQENVFLAMDRRDIPAGPPIADVDLNAVAYPNPTDGDFSVKIFAENNYDVTIDIYDNFGQLIEKRKVALVEGNNTIPFEFGPSYASQFYNIVIRRDFRYQVLRVFKP